MILSADQIKTQTMVSIENHYSKELDQIEEIINDAVTNCKPKTQIKSMLLNQYTIWYLMVRGYKIIPDGYSNDLYFISWG